MDTIAVGNTGLQLVTSLNKNFAIPEHIYNVKDYGAYGDNSHDDTVAIQNALDACVAGKGGTVYFPNGTYLIGGALKTNYSGENPNSQLYIKPITYNNAGRCTVKLLGESTFNTVNYPFVVAPTLSTSGVILKSTIDGTGVWPSVIGTMTVSGAYNAHQISIENIIVLVKANEGSGGPTMCGINLLYSSLNHIKNVYCSVDIDYIQSTLPTNHVFGLALNPTNSEMGSSVENYVGCGFYYGFCCGEGVLINSIVCFGNYIGYMSLANYYASVILNAILHANCYAIAAQQETMHKVVGDSCLIINYMSLEPRPTPNGAYWPDWVEFADVILDTDNILRGEINCNIRTIGGVDHSWLTKGNGGYNFLIRNQYYNSDYYWTTTTRPTIPGYGTRGFNITTSKTEIWDGSQWQDCW
jgi:hypothetical protein